MGWIESMKIKRNVMAPLWVMMAVLLSAPAWAAPVTNTNDTGAGSLRNAIAEAAAGDTINLPAGLGTITLTSAELIIDKALTISGPGSGKLTITRSAAGGTPEFRIFNVTSSNATVTISGVTVNNG